MGNGCLSPADLSQGGSSPIVAHGLANGKIESEPRLAAAPGQAFAQAAHGTQQQAPSQEAGVGAVNGSLTNEGCADDAWNSASVREVSAPQPARSQAASEDGGTGCGQHGRGMTEETSADSGLPQGVLHSKAPRTAAEGTFWLGPATVQALDETVLS